jgi:hypothetical protein
VVQFFPSDGAAGPVSVTRAAVVVAGPRWREGRGRVTGEAPLQTGKSRVWTAIDRVNVLARLVSAGEARFWPSFPK